MTSALRPLTPRRLRQRLVVATMVVAGHLLLLALLRHQKPALMAASPPMQVALLGRVPNGADEPAIGTLQTADHPIIPQILRSLALETPKPAVDVAPQSLSLSGYLPAESATSAGSPANPSIGEPAAGTAGANPGAKGVDCRLEQQVQSALREDPRVRAALALVPSHSRSVANVIALWDGAWTDAESLGGPAALEPLRGEIIETVLAAPTVCQGQSVLGPRFIIVPGDGRATVLAFGSGVWTWSDLLEGAAQRSPSH